MNKEKEQLENLNEIRSLMERSSRFISLSGLSGVFAGILALIGAAIAYWYFDKNIDLEYHNKFIFDNDGSYRSDFFIFAGIVSISVLVLAIGSSVFFSIRKAKKEGLSIWNNTAKLVVINLLIPLVIGGLFCLILFYRKEIHLVAPATLIFYGLALVNASKYTLNDIRFLGILETCIGLVSMIFINYGLLFWAIGFGVLHIIYGAVMYFKYEK